MNWIPSSDLTYVLIGALAATGGSFLLQWYNRRHKQDRLKTALVTEIRSVDIKGFEDRVQEMYDEHPKFDSDVRAEHKDIMFWSYGLKERIDEEHRAWSNCEVYQSNLDSIGLLDKEQVRSVIDFYKEVEIFEDELYKIANIDADVEDYEAENPQLASIDARVGDLSGDIKRLKRMKSDALEALGEDINHREGEADGEDDEKTDDNELNFPPSS